MNKKIFFKKQQKELSDALGKAGKNQHRVNSAGILGQFYISVIFQSYLLPKKKKPSHTMQWLVLILNRPLKQALSINIC